MSNGELYRWNVSEHVVCRRFHLQMTDYHVRHIKLDAAVTTIYTIYIEFNVSCLSLTLVSTTSIILTSTSVVGRTCVLLHLTCLHCAIVSNSGKRQTIGIVPYRHQLRSLRFLLVFGMCQYCWYSFWNFLFSLSLSLFIGFGF